MRIEIAERLRPYSHIPGTMCVLPGSFYSIEIFPCLIRIYDISGSSPILVNSIDLHLDAPLEQFTIQQDLERGWIDVWGHQSKGTLRYRLISTVDNHGVICVFDKIPSLTLKVSYDQKEQQVSAKESVVFLAKKSPFIPYEPSSKERLSLGNHKAQDWDLVKRRMDLKEIMPIWFRSGQLVPDVDESLLLATGNLALLQRCREVIADNRPEYIGQAFTNLFKAGFSDLLVPRLIDTQYQGFTSSQSVAIEHISPLVLLRKGSQLIRQLFIEQEEEIIKILPHLPPEFACGRFMHLQMAGGMINLEWTKKIIRRMEFVVRETQEYHFRFKKIRSYRLRKNSRDDGQVLSSDQPLLLEKNCHYLFDNFT